MATLSLESFETVLAEEPVDNTAYNNGYQDGLAAGLASAEADNAALAAALVQAISDINFTYAEASSQTIDQLAPLFSALITSVLPQIIATGFPTALAQELQQMATDALDQPLQLFVHPDQKAAVDQALGAMQSAASVKSDPTLDQHAAWLQCGDHETQFNMDRLLAQITDAISAIGVSEDRTSNHG